MFKKYISAFIFLQCFLAHSMEEPVAYPLHFAIKKGWLTQVQEMIRKESVTVFDLDDQGKLPLYYACLYREYEIIKFLIENDADKSAVENAHFLAKPDYLEVVELLALDQITQESFESILNQRLERLMREQKILSAYLLIAKYPYVGKNLKIDWTITDEFGKSLLFYAVENENSSLIIKFSALKLGVNAKDIDGKPLIFYAVETGNIQNIILLIDKGADLKFDYKGHNALYCVSNKLKEPEMIQFLLDHDIEINVDAILSCLVEIPVVVLCSALGKDYNEIVYTDGRLNESKFNDFLLNSKSLKPFFVTTVQDFIRENNSKAVESLLLLLPLSIGNVKKLLNYYLSKSDHDNPEMLEILLNYLSIENTLHTLKTYFQTCIDHGKTKSARAIRLFADLNNRPIEKEVLEFFKEASNAYNKAIKEYKSIATALQEELEQALLKRRTYANWGNMQAAHEIDQRITNINLEVVQARAILEGSKAKYANIQFACCPFHILKDLSQANAKDESRSNSMVDAIDSNDPHRFMNYIYQDQSDGREGHIATMPNIHDFIYALTLDPNVEMNKLSQRGISCNRQKYIKNLCKIMDSMLLVNEALAGQLCQSLDNGKNILHTASFHACAEMLNYLLNRLYEKIPAKVVKLVNAKTGDEKSLSPLDIAFMKQSEAKIRILIKFGARLVDLNRAVLKFILTKNRFIKLIVENMNNLSDLDEINDVISYWTIEEIESFMAEKKEARIIAELERRAALELAEQMHQIELAKLEKVRAQRELNHRAQLEQQRVMFESGKFRNKLAVIGAGLCVAAFMTYQLFKSNPVIYKQTMAFK